MESGRARASDRGTGSGGLLGQAEGIVSKVFYHVVTPSGLRSIHGVHGCKGDGNAGAVAQELSHLQAIRLP